MCGRMHTSFGGCARGAKQPFSISSVDDIVHAKSYAFQKACLSHHPLMMSCIQRAMPIAHTFKASMCKKCPRAKVLTSMGCSPSIQIFTPPFEPFAPFHNPPSNIVQRAAFKCSAQPAHTLHSIYGSSSSKVRAIEVPGINGTCFVAPWRASYAFKYRAKSSGAPLLVLWLM